ncbi:MAG: ATPase, T2SS/T4P/T4SS family [Oscillospiraceae bacterium]
MNTYEKAIELLPRRLLTECSCIPASEAEEFRLRAGRKAAVLIGGTEIPISDVLIEKSDIDCVIERATNASVHTAQSSIAKGFINCSGGIRIGLCGTGIIDDGKVTGMRGISSLAIRIPHEIRGCGQAAIDRIKAEPRGSVLILSPPGYGKTTFLRECIRQLSDSGKRVSVADERGELAAVHRGVPQFDLGNASDIMSGVPKAQAVMMLLRAMNPQIIALDEISSPEDAEAAETASGCGVRLIATAHAADKSELHSRPVYRRLLELGVFKNAVVIENRCGKRSYSYGEI